VKGRALAFALAVSAAACVEIATGPSGVVSIRLLTVPPSIVAGDQLRDSNGAVIPLRAVAFGERGDSVTDAPFRYSAVALSRDTSDSARRVPIVVDSITGATSAPGPTPLNPLARVAVRLGDRLQVLDTIAVVKKPTRLGRATQNGDSVRSFAFLCTDTSSRASTSVQQLALGAGDTVRITNAVPLAALLTADSTGTLRAPVPSYYVRFEILQPASIPEATLPNGARRPSLAIIRDPASERATNTDTTDTQGVATAYLRVVAAGLAPTGAFADSIITVRVRASARTSTTAVVPAPVEYELRLRRITRLPNSGALSGAGCGR
jgi:hypothetical protein